MKQFLRIIHPKLYPFKPSDQNHSGFTHIFKTLYLIRANSKG